MRLKNFVLFFALCGPLFILSQSSFELGGLHVEKRRYNINNAAYQFDQSTAPLIGYNYSFQLKGYWETSVGVSVMAYKIRYANWVAGIDPFSPPNYVSTSLINTTETYLTGTLPVRVHYKPKGFDFSMGGVVLFNMNEQIIKKKGTITTHRSETAFRNIDFLQNGNNLLAEIGVGFLFTKNIGLFAKAARGKDFRYLGGSMVFAFSKKEWIVRKHL